MDIGHGSASMIFDDYLKFKTLLIGNLIFFQINILHFKEQHTHTLINKTKLPSQGLGEINHRIFGVHISCSSALHAHILIP